MHFILKIKDLKAFRMEKTSVRRVFGELSLLIFTDTGEDSKLVHRQKRPKVDTLFSSLFFDASERRVENSRVHFLTFSPVSVNSFINYKIFGQT